MGFFYISILSIPFLGIVYGVLLLLFWGVARVTRGMPGRNALLLVVAAVFLVLPVAEELWIGYTFGKLCKKDAGIFVKRAVEVDGFYDSTMRSAYENTKPGRYRFVEHAKKDRNGFERVERADEAMRNEALTWYARTHPGEERPKDRSIFYPRNEREAIAVLPNGIDAWRITKIDRPTARYHYRNVQSHNLVAYKIKAFEWIVEDTNSKSVIAREKAYARQASWFYIGLDRPTMFCPVFGSHGERLTGGLYRLALKPSK